MSYTYVRTPDNYIHVVDDITPPTPPVKKTLPCVWTKHETRDGIVVFHTSCGESYSFYPWLFNESQYLYCPHCQKKRSDGL